MDHDLNTFEGRERYTDADKRMVIDTIRTECELAELGPMSTMVVLNRTQNSLIHAPSYNRTRDGQVASALRYGRELVAEHRQTDDIIRRVVARSEAREAA